MKVAVIGAGGQLGKCFEAIDRMGSHVEYHFYDRSQIDISDPKSYLVLEERPVDMVVNCAAYTQVDKAEEEQEQAFRINVTGPEYLANFSADREISVVHFSTDYIFAPATQPIRESHPIRPINYYGQTKWKGEEAIRNSGARHLILRTSWLYSGYGHNFFKTMLRLAKDRSEISVVDDQTGSPTYAMDLAMALDDILTRWEDLGPGKWGTYHFANKGQVTWFEFAREILKNNKVLVHPIPTSAYPTPARRPEYSVLDSSLYERTFQWEIPDWKEALERCRKDYHW